MSAVRPGSLLIATPMLEDPNFRRSVVYMIEHGEAGSLGLIVNRPLEAELGDIWEGCPPALAELRCCAQGGPVEPGKGLLVHGFEEVPGATAFGPGSWIGGEVEAICSCYDTDDEAPRHGPRLFLGHAGWDYQQLAGEIAVGAWIVRDGRAHLLTGSTPPDDLWQSCAVAGAPPHSPGLN